jgi:hypothetical protein
MYSKGTLLVWLLSFQRLEPGNPKEGTMLVKIPIRTADQGVGILSEDITGTPAEREEHVHLLSRQVGNPVAQAVLQEAAAQAGHPTCCGRSLENRGRARSTIQGLDGPVCLSRTRFRCARCGHEQYAADGLLLCGRHRITRPLAKRASQLATIEHFPPLPRLLFDQHGVRLSQEELLALVHDGGGEADQSRRAEGGMPCTD